MAEEKTVAENAPEKATASAEETQTAEGERSTLTKLAGRGEEAIRKLAAELDQNERIHGARDRAQRVGRSALHQLNIASVEELDELSARVAELEERIARLEGGA